MIWTHRGEYQFYIDDENVRQGAIHKDFTSREYKVRGRGATPENYDPKNPVYLEKPDLLKELNRMPVFLDSHGSQFNEDYLLKRIEVERELRNNRYVPQGQIDQDNKIQRNGAHWFDDQVNAVGLTLFFATKDNEIQVQSVSIAEVKRIHEHHHHHHHQ